MVFRMRIEGKWITEAGVQSIFTTLQAAGHKGYFVGGCVRNALLRAPINDIDIATDATPAQVLRLAKQAGIRAVETGIDHGTITLVVDSIPYEVTTFRRDVETDGRHAVVAFSTDIHDDARRRDFTINALYADQLGNVVDPLDGLSDLEARLVRFIESPNDRIKEDYLRILRFFRFYAWYGDPNEGIDAEGLAACSENLAGLDTLAKERIGAEILKLLAAADPAPAIASMAQSGVLNAILAGSDAENLPVLIHLEAENRVEPKALRRLALLGGHEVENSLRLSNKESKTLKILRDEIGTMRQASELGYRIGFDLAVDALLLRGAIFQTPIAENAFVDAKRGADQVFPVKAADLMPALSGPNLGKALRKLEFEWVLSDFLLTKETLLHQMRDL